jgi:hypothetical protein
MTILTHELLLISFFFYAKKSAILKWIKKQRESTVLHIQSEGYCESTGPSKSRQRNLVVGQWWCGRSWNNVSNFQWICCWIYDLYSSRRHWRSFASERTAFQLELLYKSCNLMIGFYETFPWSTIDCRQAHCKHQNLSD